MAQSEHEHAHDHAQAAVGQLKLNDGKKWATDAPLRAGMAAIQSAFDAEHAAIHAGTATDAQYEALAGRIEAQVNSIVANCKLPPEADANLHYVIADLSQGVSLMRGATPRARGTTAPRSCTAPCAPTTRTSTPRTRRRSG